MVKTTIVREFEVLNLERCDSIFIIRLKNDRNLIDNRFVRDYNAALDVIEHRVKGSVVLITVGGDDDKKHFCTGLDLDWMKRTAEMSPDQQQLPVSPSGANPTPVDTGVDFLINVKNLFARVLVLPYITIAAINGHTIGAGSMLALSHDYRFMSGDARLRLQIPLRPNRIAASQGIVQLLKAKIANPAVIRDLVLGAQRMDACDAYDAGIVDVVVDIHPTSTVKKQGHSSTASSTRTASSSSATSSSSSSSNRSSSSSSISAAGYAPEQGLRLQQARGMQPGNARNTGAISTSTTRSSLTSTSLSSLSSSSALLAPYLSAVNTMTAGTSSSTSPHSFVNAAWASVRAQAPPSSSPSTSTSTPASTSTNCTRAPPLRRIVRAESVLTAAVSFATHMIPPQDDRPTLRELKSELYVSVTRALLQSHLLHAHRVAVGSFPQRLIITDGTPLQGQIDTRVDAELVSLPSSL